MTLVMVDSEWGCLAWRAMERSPQVKSVKIVLPMMTLCADDDESACCDALPGGR
jgi:hypothetical protein